MTKERSRAKAPTVKDGSAPALYEMKPEERRTLDDIRRRHTGRIPAPRIRVVDKDGVPRISPDHPDEDVGNILLMAALGTTDSAFFSGLLGQLANAGTQGRRLDERGVNFMLGVVKGIEPRDEVESMLASQMAAVHMSTMTFARRLAHVENIPQQDSAERAFNKLARTFAMQVEALKRYRSAGEQKVTVEHVTIHRGGQAIIGNVSQAGGGGAGKKRGTTPCTRIPTRPR